MEAVEQHRKQLLGVLLLLVVELVFEFSYDWLKLKGCDWVFVFEPQLPDKFSEADCEFALSSERIGKV